jgi:nucleoside-diphosphate-sugar epimerase
MKIAVTGATGFIGRHVINALQATNAEVVAVVRQPCVLAKGIRTVVLNLEQVTADSFAQLDYPDVLIHLAWGGLPNYKSLHHFENELPLHYRFIKQLVESGLSTVVVAGTCFEYGMQSGALSADSPVLPANPYAYAKAALHQQLRFLQNTHPFKLTWARLFYLYGAGQAPSSLYSLFQQAMAQNDNVFNMSGGEQLRDYLPVETAAQQLIQLAIQQDNATVNICSGQPVSVRRLVEQWREQKNSDIQLNLGYYPYPDYEPLAFWGVPYFTNNTGVQT